MAQNYRKLVDGLNLVPKASTASNSLGDLEVLSSTSKIYFHNGTVNAEILTGSSSSIITNKMLDDSTVFFVDTSDNTKTIKFDAAGTTNTSTTILSSQTANRILTLPDATDTLVARNTTDTLTNKTIAAGSNTITGLTNTNLSGSAAITNANLASMAAHTFKGNNTGSPSTPLDLTATQLTAELNIFTSSLQGLVPSSGGGTVNFLRADGTFATPPNSGGTVTTIGAFDGQAPSANGLVISGANLYAQSADATHPGMVNTTTQTFAGAKTFSTSVKTPLLTDNGAGLSITSSSNQNITVAPAGTGRLIVNAPNGLEMQQITTPSNPSSGDNSLYFKADNNLYSLSSGGAETLIGSGGGSGGVNFLTLDTSFQSTKPNNFNFESTIGDWVSYNNAGGNMSQNLTSTSDFGNNSSSNWLAQSFISLLTASVNTVTFEMNHAGGAVSGNIVCDIYNDSAGNPGTLIGTSDPVNSTSITGSVAPVVFTFSTSPSLTSGSTYYAVINVSGVTFGSGNFNIAFSSANPYANGKVYSTSNSGGSWSSFASDDLYFDVESNAVPLTLTGGSASITASRTTTGGEVLDGIASLKVVKGASNSQYQGVSCVANIPLGYRGQIASFNFPFKIISGSMVQGDVQVLAYDVTNSALISIFNPDIISTGKILGTILIPNSCSQIRFAIGFTSASTSAVTFSFDDVQFGPQDLVVGPGPLALWYGYHATTTANSGWYANSGTFVDPINQDSTISLVQSDNLNMGTVTSYGGTGSAALPGLIFNPPSLGHYAIEASTTFNVAGANQEYAVRLWDGTNILDASQESYPGPSNVQTYVPLKLRGIINVTTLGSKTISIQLASTGGTALISANQLATNRYIDWSIEQLDNPTSVVTQNSQIMSIANILATGTQVSATPPTSLGQYRAYYRAAAANNNLSDCSALATPPSAANGIFIDGSIPGNSVGSATVAQSYDIFIGKNVNYQLQWFPSTGRTGSLVVGTTQFGNVADVGAYTGYDPTTGILQVNASLFYNGGESIRLLGSNIGLTVTSSTTGYFDVTVSQAVIPVQFPLNEPVYLKEVFANGVDPGGFASGVWQTRTLNTVENQQPWISLSSNQFTLQPGTYEIHGDFPAFYVNSHQAKLYDITNSANIKLGTARYSAQSGGGVDNSSIIMGLIAVTGVTTFEIQHHCQTTKSTLGVGVADQSGTFGVDGVFGQIRIEKLR